MRKGANAHSVERIRLSEEVDQRLDARIGFRVDIEHGIWQFFEEIFQERYRFDSRDPDFLQFGNCHLGNVSIDSTRSQQLRIVKGDENPIFGDLNIGLEISVAEITGCFESR
jgi:hypothetical protein